MIAFLLALAVQDTTIVIHPDSSSATLEARALPRVVTDEVIRFYNAAGTTRLVGRTRLPRGNEWRGNVAVRNGPVLVAGRVQGSLVVINGDLLFDTGAEVTGNVIVVGGIVDDTAKARIGGEVRQYREPLLFRLRHEGDELVYAPNLRRRLFNPGAHVSWGDADSRSSLTIATGGTFNRVEGLPIVFGPLFDWKLQQNFRMRVDALGVFRSAGDLSDKRSDLGYMFRGELRSGEVRPVGLGCGPLTSSRPSRIGACTTPRSGGPRSCSGVTIATTAATRGRVSVRLGGAGCVGGDPLPLQRRLSLGGPDPMPGHPFRSISCDNDIVAPAFANSRLAACDRVLAFQTEYRGHVKLNWSYNPSKDDKADRDEGSSSLFWLEGFDVVVFADAGQAWLVGNGPNHVPAGHIPRFDSWLVDVGLGVDWGGFGVYIAKAVTTGGRLRFTARLDHRF